MSDPIPSTPMQCYVRVTGALDGGFVEFEFSIGDPDLAVELVMTYPQFQQFTQQHQARHLTPEQGARLDYERLKWRYGEPGINH